MKRLYWLLGFLAVAATASAQNNSAGRNENPAGNPDVAYEGPVVYRSEFVSYDVREHAEKADVGKNQFYVPLKLGRGSGAGGTVVYGASVDLPYAWLDRQTFVQVSGLQAYELYVNGGRVGYGEDSRTPVQFDVSEHITDGMNTVELRQVEGTGHRLEEDLKAAVAVPQAVVFSQPKIRIEDYEIRFEPDSTGRHGILEISVALANSYNYRESVTIGYDIYSPQGKLLYYDMKEISLEGLGRDTLSFREPIWRANDNFWSAEKPVLHYGQLSVKRGNRMIEYVPYKVGYGRTELTGETILRNGQPISVNAARYNVSADAKATEQQVKALKKEGVTVLCPDYPQPMWFYDVCDRVGMYVIDRANINTMYRKDDRRIGGALSNDPAWTGAFEARNRAMYSRARNHSCVIARFPGGDCGNGVNMYRAYAVLKALNPKSIVIYNDAAGEWNTDRGPVSIRQ